MKEIQLAISTRPGNKGRDPGQPYSNHGSGLQQSKNESRQSASVSLTTECHHPRERRETDPETKEIYCRNCGEKLQSSLVQLGGPEFDGHAPDESIVMDNNLGSPCGPERTKQVLSALNQDKKTAPTGVNFHISKLNLLQLWAMSSSPTDRMASEILSITVREIEKKRGFKLDPARVDSIARACKNGIGKAELKRRLARWEMEGAIQGVFAKEGLWPP